MSQIILEQKKYSILINEAMHVFLWHIIDEKYDLINNTFKFLTVVYTWSTPREKMKYSQALSYACQGGSILRNLSPTSAGTMSE
jgi:hypothetical protein